MIILNWLISIQRLPGSEAEAFANYQTAIEKDTALENKIKYINQAAELAKKLGDRKQQANWLGVAYYMDKNPNQTDLYNYGYAHYQAGNYDSSVNLFCNVYETKYPNEIFGYLWCARSHEAKDTTKLSDSAVAAYEKLAQMSMQLDSAKYKGQAKNSLFKLATNANDFKKDQKAALAYIEQILVFDPEDPNALKIKEILVKAINKPAKPATTTNPPKKPSTKTGGGPAPKKK